ncbi:Tyrosinase [Mycena kentingensis (nom. inval.)]|nr:Tyrosinase [Mycena kentingensis (nom. inval.)]
MPEFHGRLYIRRGGIELHPTYLNSNTMSIITTGALTGGVQPRLEINDFLGNKLYRDLLFQAIPVAMNKAQSDFTSYYQIAGIHGLPPQSYDGVGATQANSNSEGYCTHGSTLFPPWHRPYVALFEAKFQKAAMGIAQNYTPSLRPSYVDAATNLRWPYWDWASKAVPPPEVISLDTVPITAPSGLNTTITNPLRRYTFRGREDRSFSDRYTTFVKSTVRHSGGVFFVQGGDNVNELTSTLNKNGPSYQANTYNLLTQVKSWPAFSNDNANAGGSATSSLEGIHDGIHVDVGGNGHMSDPSVAAFDPIFFLHHCNVDRMLALWSALNPGVWVTPGTQPGGTWTLNSNQAVDKDTGLTPFRSSPGGFWTSSAVVSTSTFGYTYPEFIGLDMSNSTAVRDAITTKVNALYAPKNSGKRKPRSESVQSTTFDWSVNIIVDKHACGGSFCVRVFIGATYVGSHCAFARSTPNLPPMLIRGAVHLTRVIEEIPGMPLSLDPSVVEPYLTHNLRWVVEKAGGDPVAIADVPSLKVTVFRTPMRAASAPGQFPIAGEPIEHPDITRSQPGGAAVA